MSTALTAHYQRIIPFALLHPSPGLAALHASRSRLLDPTPLQATHCSKCGSFLLGGQGDIRVQRLPVKKKKGGPAPRVLRITCSRCGSHDDLPLERGNAALYPKRKRVPDVTTVQPTMPTPSTACVTPALPKARLKKRSGLQDMLLRNRMKVEKEREEREKESSSGGLAVYLAALQ